MADILPHLTEVMTRLPQERPAYLPAGLVEERLDSVEAEDLDGKLLKLADFLREEWLPALEAQSRCIKAWKAALDGILAEMASIPHEARREILGSFQGELSKIGREDEAEIKPLIKAWRGEVKATRAMLRQLAPRGKSDPVYLAVRQFMDFAEAQYALLPAFSRYLGMFDRKIRKIK